MPETKEDICASKQNESRDKNHTVSLTRTWRTLPVQNKVLASGMWWDGLWCSLNHTQILFGKALDVSPWDCVQSLQSLLTQTKFMYLTSGSHIFNWTHLLIVFLQSHSTRSGLCYFKVFYAEKHVSKTILWPSAPPAYAHNTKLSLTLQSATSPYKFLIWNDLC